MTVLCSQCSKHAECFVPYPFCREHARDYFGSLVFYGATTNRPLEDRPRQYHQEVTDAKDPITLRADALLRQCMGILNHAHEVERRKLKNSDSRDWKRKKTAAKKVAAATALPVEVELA